MRKILSLTLFAALLFLGLAGCVSVNFGGPGSIIGRGDPEKYVFNVGEYSAIRVEGFCEINYYAAPSNTVTLEVQPNLREHYNVEVRNGELVVSMKRRINFSGLRSPILTVSAPTLERLTMSGAGTFTTHDTIVSPSFNLRLSGAGKIDARVDVDRLTADLSGAGQLILSGTADTAEMTMSGAGQLNALALQTRAADVRMSGAGEISVNCAENLNITASGMGAVRYKGGATANINRSGIVVVEKLD